MYLNSLKIDFIKLITVVQCTILSILAFYTVPIEARRPKFKLSLNSTETAETYVILTELITIYST